MNRNYGRFCIKFPQSRMKGERHRLRPLSLYWSECNLGKEQLATGQWFFPGTPVSSTNETDRHFITEILLKVALNTTNHKPKPECVLEVLCLPLFQRLFYWILEVFQQCGAAMATDTKHSDMNIIATWHDACFIWFLHQTWLNMKEK
jgi:hypothetical protein